MILFEPQTGKGTLSFRVEIQCWYPDKNNLYVLFFHSTRFHF